MFHAPLIRSHERSSVALPQRSHARPTVVPRAAGLSAGRRQRVADDGAAAGGRGRADVRPVLRRGGSGQPEAGHRPDRGRPDQPAAHFAALPVSPCGTHSAADRPRGAPVRSVLAYSVRGSDDVVRLIQIGGVLRRVLRAVPRPGARVLRSPGGGAEVAADLMAETFARALVRYRKVPPDAPEAWLFTIARNLLIDSARRGQVGARAAASCGSSRSSLTMTTCSGSPRSPKRRTSRRRCGPRTSRPSTKRCTPAPSTRSPTSRWPSDCAARRPSCANASAGPSPRPAP